jgi:NADH-quinone oxidoreductase subunit N
MNVGAFLVITQVSGFDENLRSVDDYRGLAAGRPLLAATLALFLLSLIGIPFTGGFFAKFYIFTAAINSGHIGLAVVGLLNSGVACFYYLRLLASVYAKSEKAEEPSSLLPAPNGIATTAGRSAVGVPAMAALFLAAIATLLLGVYPNRVLGLANAAASGLRDGLAQDQAPASQRTTPQTVSINAPK